MAQSVPVVTMELQKTLLTSNEQTVIHTRSGISARKSREAVQNFYRQGKRKQHVRRRPLNTATPSAHTNTVDERHETTRPPTSTPTHPTLPTPSSFTAPGRRHFNREILRKSSNNPDCKPGIAPPPTNKSNQEKTEIAKGEGPQRALAKDASVDDFLLPAKEWETEEEVVLRLEALSSCDDASETRSVGGEICAW